ncbi:hypothetical protein B0I35DRAFT_482814 [Stachybotrys elegans]|uniref:Uncharacterized protein n=1 Tax=Stachybotrys elegans TaxID=80388 RepID=A0A8K0SIL2_9HYPO|nr:hypothetical protein B0I35DRAFT_482814 [Stachybotrys elegans]
MGSSGPLMDNSRSSTETTMFLSILCVFTTLSLLSIGVRLLFCRLSSRSIRSSDLGMIAAIPPCLLGLSTVIVLYQLGLDLPDPNKPSEAWSSFAITCALQACFLSALLIVQVSQIRCLMQWSKEFMGKRLHLCFVLVFQYFLPLLSLGQIVFLPYCLSESASEPLPETQRFEMVVLVCRCCGLITAFITATAICMPWTSRPCVSLLRSMPISCLALLGPVASTFRITYAILIWRNTAATLSGYIQSVVLWLVLEVSFDILASNLEFVVALYQIFAYRTRRASQLNNRPRRRRWSSLVRFTDDKSLGDGPTAEHWEFSPSAEPRLAYSQTVGRMGGRAA